ncbi:Uma2 family endonuclease [Streptomyces daliensis]|uniref:Uma2 family endonuclease n=1 Tax=Streptomyces daliensis TaxID=299421 RepID=A0A8T4IZC9_9ACTN|nr:Uma2 family endonuclease [Streptomyces daliensis]
MALTAPERESDAVVDGSKVPSVEDAFEAFDAAAPEGWRVELVEGEIRVVPPANGEHEEIVSELSHQVTVRGTGTEETLRNFTGLGLLIPGASPTGKIIPDLVVAPKGSFSDGQEFHDPSPALLVGEVTSRSTGDIDRGPKLRGYARAGIPVYLLIDREADEVVVHSEPKGEEYTRRVQAKFSKKIALPDPLGFELDTAEF